MAQSTTNKTTDFNRAFGDAKKQATAKAKEEALQKLKKPE